MFVLFDLFKLRTVIPWFPSLLFTAFVGSKRVFVPATCGSPVNLASWGVMAASEPGENTAARKEALDTQGSNLPEGAVFYDAECPLCLASVEFLRRRDRAGRLRFLPLDSDAGRRACEAAELDPDGPSSLVFVDAVGCLKESAAVLGTLAWLGGGWRLLAWLGMLVPPWIADAVYRQIAARRRRRRDAATR